MPSRDIRPERVRQAMGAATVGPTGMIQFVPTVRPAADMMRFTVATEGTFVLAAPR